MNLNLRENKGWTYGVNAHLRYLEEKSELMVRTRVQSEKTVPALEELLAEMNDMATQSRPITPSELERERDAILYSFPAKFETAGGTMWSYRHRLIHGLPLRDDTRDELATLTVSEVSQHAAANLGLDSKTVLIVGPMKLLFPDLCRVARSQRWGKAAVHVLEADGRPREGSGCEIHE
jgi:zinc protease